MRCVFITLNGDINEYFGQRTGMLRECMIHEHANIVVYISYRHVFFHMSHKSLWYQQVSIKNVARHAITRLVRRYIKQSVRR